MSVFARKENAAILSSTFFVMLQNKMTKMIWQCQYTDAHMG